MNIQILQQSIAENQGLVNNTIDTVFVTRFLNGMLRTPTEIRLRFKTLNNMPAITVTLTYRDKKGRLIKEELTTIANGELINAVISAMGSNLKPINAFQEDGNNIVEETSNNFELEMFEAFMESSYHLKIEDDFISSNGDRFLHAVFSIGFHYDIHFYLKRDEHIEELLNKALTA